MHLDPATFALFLVASAAVGVAPGPSTLLVLSHALGGDKRQPFCLIAGALLGNLVLVLATVSGLSALILASPAGFEVLRWLGAGYLIYLGFCYWRAPADPLRARAAHTSACRALVAQAFLTSVTNPKGLAFYFAFLPQFVTPGADTAPQLLFLGAAYVAVFIAALSLYALAGQRLARLFARPRAVAWKNRFTGGLLTLAGLALLRYERP